MTQRLRTSRETGGQRRKSASNAERVHAAKIAPRPGGGRGGGAPDFGETPAGWRSRGRTLWCPCEGPLPLPSRRASPACAWRLWVRIERGNGRGESRVRRGIRSFRAESATRSIRARGRHGERLHAGRRDVTSRVVPFLTTLRIFLWKPTSARGLAIAHTARSSPSPPSLSSFDLDGVLSFFSFFSFPIATDRAAGAGCKPPRCTAERAAGRVDASATNRKATSTRGTARGRCDEAARRRRLDSSRKSGGQSSKFTD